MDTEEIGQHAAAALAFLAPRARAIIARQLTRVLALERERRALVADMLARLAAEVADNPPTPSGAQIVEKLAEALMLLRYADEPKKGTRP